MSFFTLSRMLKAGNFLFLLCFICFTPITQLIGQHCGETLVVYSGNCDDPNDSFHPTFTASCIRSATPVAPTAGPDPFASCNQDIICIQSLNTDWEFTITAASNYTFTGISADFLFPVNMGTAGGPRNASHCTNIPYTAYFYRNGDLIESKSGTVSKDVIVTADIHLSQAIHTKNGDEIKVVIKGNPSSSSCQLFELAGLRVVGCCGGILPPPPPPPPSGCNENLVTYSGNCDDPNDSFHPTYTASCILQASQVAPTAGPGPASCNDDIICIQSEKTDWDFTITAASNLSFTGITANFLFPVSLGTAGGPRNDAHCSNISYTVLFYKNGSLIESKNGSVNKDIIQSKNIYLNQPIYLKSGEDIRVVIKGNPTSSSCQLFELAGLSVVGCCGVTPPPPPCELTVDVGNNMTLCDGNNVAITASVSGASKCDTETLCHKTAIVTYSGACDDPSDCLKPVNIASCLSNVSGICPTNGPNPYASCNNNIICIASMFNDWDFSMTAQSTFQFEELEADFWYPTDGSSAGGAGNSSSCPTSYNAIVKFYLNGNLQSQSTVNVRENRIITKVVKPNNPILVHAGNSLRIVIDGLPTSESCDLFELAGLRVIGCCNPVTPNPVVENTYNWSGPGVFNSTDPTIVVSKAGTYTVTVTDCNGCTATDKVIITQCDPCDALGGDSDGDGICNDEDCAPFDVNFPKAPGTSCNDFNPNTENDVIQADGCTCKGVITSPCASAGGDSDGDGVCNDEDCAPFDVNFPKPVGTACNDHNPNTKNDVIQADGCTCKGQPVAPPTGNPCDDTSITTGKGNITISGLDGAPVVFIQVISKTWQPIYQCWDNQCSKPVETIHTGNGEFLVFVKYFNKSFQLICEVKETIIVSSTTSGGTTGGGTTGDNGGTSGGTTGGGTTGDNGGTSGSTTGGGTTGNNGGTNGGTTGGGTTGDNGGTTGNTTGGGTNGENPQNTKSCGDVTVTVGNGTINIEGTNGEKYFCKVDRLTNGYTSIVNCTSAACANNTWTFNNLTAGKYSIRLFHADSGANYWQPVCESMEMEMAGNLTSNESSNSRTISSMNKEETVVKTANKISLKASSNDIRISEVTTPSSNAKKVAVYPNPAKDLLNIKLGQYVHHQVQFHLINSFGQEVRILSIEEANDATVQLNISSLPQGLYYLQVKVNNQLTETQKVLIVE